MFETLAPYADFPMKLVFTNLWLFRPVLLKVLPIISAQAGAMIRTTVAFTMMSGSEACNVMPRRATVRWIRRSTGLRTPNRTRRPGGKSRLGNNAGTRTRRTCP